MSLYHLDLGLMISWRTRLSLSCWKNSLMGFSGRKVYLFHLSIFSKKRHASTSAATTECHACLPKFFTGTFEESQDCSYQTFAVYSAMSKEHSHQIILISRDLPLDLESRISSPLLYERLSPGHNEYTRSSYLFFKI